MISTTREKKLVVFIIQVRVSSPNFWNDLSTLFCALDFFFSFFVLWIFSDILPVKEGSEVETEAFLKHVIQICLEFIKDSNDRNNKVLDFKQPDEMLKIYDFTIPDEPLNIDQLLKDCSDCLKNQVKTGKPLLSFSNSLFSIFSSSNPSLLSSNSSLFSSNSSLLSSSLSQLIFHDVSCHRIFCKHFSRLTFPVFTDGKITFA